MTLLLIVLQELGIWNSWQVCFEIMLFHTILYLYGVSWLLQVISDIFLRQASVLHLFFVRKMCFIISASLLIELANLWLEILCYLNFGDLRVVAKLLLAWRGAQKTDNIVNWKGRERTFIPLTFELLFIYLFCFGDNPIVGGWDDLNPRCFLWKY